jgi:hypothetical protein
MHRWLAWVLGAVAVMAPAGAEQDAADAHYAPAMTFDVTSARENKQANVNQGISMSGSFTPHTTAPPCQPS